MEVKSLQDLVAFDVNGLLCGIDMRHVREINKNLQITKVHRAPETVRGVLNLRGNIVTIMNMHRLLDQDNCEIHTRMRIIVVQHGSENIGLLVDEVHDILRIQNHEISAAPTQLQHPPAKLIQSVCQRPDSLILVLELDELLKPFKSEF